MRLDFIKWLNFFKTFGSVRTADYCFEKFGSAEFLKSVGFVPCVYLNFEPCL